MRRHVIETVMGGAVLIVAAVFIIFAFTATGMGTGDGYRVHARFDSADGLTSGTDVRMSGVRIGRVVSQQLNPETYFAEVTLSIDSRYRLPEDTSARVLPEGIMGGNYIALEPGGADEMIPNGGQLRHTQGAVNLMDLVSRYMFSNGGGQSDAP